MWKEMKSEPYKVEINNEGIIRADINGEYVYAQYCYTEGRLTVKNNFIIQGAVGKYSLEQLVYKYFKDAAVDCNTRIYCKAMPEAENPYRIDYMRKKANADNYAYDEDTAIKFLSFAKNYDYENKKCEASAAPEAQEEVIVKEPKVIGGTMKDFGKNPGNYALGYYTAEGTCTYLHKTAQYLNKNDKLAALSENKDERIYFIFKESMSADALDEAIKALYA